MQADLSFGSVHMLAMHSCRHNTDIEHTLSNMPYDSLNDLLAMLNFYKFKVKKSTCRGITKQYRNVLIFYFLL